MFVPLVRLHVHVQPVLPNLIKNDYKIVIHKLNQDMTVLKNITITQYLVITMIGS